MKEGVVVAKKEINRSVMYSSGPRRAQIDHHSLIHGTGSNGKAQRAKNANNDMVFLPSGIVVKKKRNKAMHGEDQSTNGYLENTINYDKSPNEISITNKKADYANEVVSHMKDDEG